MKTLLPVGSYVRVTGGDAWRADVIGKVVGYDMGRTKYEIGVRYGGWGEWLFLDGGTWVFPRHVEQIGEDEALTVAVER